MQKLIVFLFGLLFLLAGCSVVESQPAVFVWGSTSCPHCVAAMPVFESSVYNIYSGDLNVHVYALSSDAFDTTIPQTTGSVFGFSGVVGQDCAYIPAWVVLDDMKHVVAFSCGGEKTIDDMLDAIASLMK